MKHIVRLGLGALTALALSPASAAPAPGRLAALASATAQVEGIAAAKRLQYAYAQYAEYGLWNEMADLFAKDATARFGDRLVKGREAIRAYLLSEYGGGKDGLAPGGVRHMLPMTPVLNFDPDGRTIHGRWHELAMLGRFGGEARWAGGIYENDYAREGGVWKIAGLHYYPQFAGSYADGWRNVERDLQVVPYHYTPDTAGLIAPPSAPALEARGNLPALDARLARLAEEQAVTNLQYVYGYYVDQRMWDDVADLFDRDATLTIEGVGSWAGAKSIRHGLERDGPQGLKGGEINNHVQIDMIVTVSPDGREARARGLDLGMTGANGAKGYWSTATFENRYVKRDGVWRLAEVHLYPLMKADYTQGWAKSRIAETVSAGDQAPDRTVPALAPGTIPAFSYANPATGRMPHYPAGASVASVALGWSRPAAKATGPAIDAVEARLRRVAAYEGAENASSAFGNYIDDFDWDNLGLLFAEKGAREMPYAGFYIGPAHITKAEVTKWGRPKRPRLSIPIHLRIQPVIDVAADGRSANIRTRLFSIGGSWDRPGSFSGGMYPNDQAALEKGTWKLWSVAIDEFYYNSASYAAGWTKVPYEPAEKTPDPLLSSYLPDVPLTALGKREQAFIPGSTEFNRYVHNGPAYPGYPSAVPMWFSYKNPVSGRTPQYYWPDCVTCVARPETSLKANGY